MSQSGGAAAINGFLYQITHHIDWLAKATPVASPHDHELRNAQIVLVVEHTCNDVSACPQASSR